MNGFYLEVAAVVPVLSGASREELEELGSKIEQKVEDDIRPIDENLNKIGLYVKDLAKKVEPSVDANTLEFELNKEDVHLTFHDINKNNKEPYGVLLPSATTMSAGVMSAKDKQVLENLFEEAVKIDSFEVEELGDGIGINYGTFNRHGGSIEIPFATEKRAGVMSAKDKKALDTATSRALRALFVAAGAEYNDTDQIIQKTAPWKTEEKWRLEDGGYTYWEEPAIIDHLPKHYYLNGLGDITEEEMIDIYNLPHKGFFPHAYSNIDCKTMLCEGNGVYGAISADVLNAWMINSKAEVVSSDKELFCENGTMNSSFNRCSNLKYIIFPKFYCQYVAFNNAFTRCYSLIRVNLERLSNNISFADSVNVEKKCILSIISKSTTSSAITITLHPDAYARIASQPDIIEALEAKPLITLVSA